MLTQQAIAIQLNRSDDVLIACQDVPAGTLIDEYRLTVQNPVPAGHKIAVRNISSGEAVRRYNQIIGFASKPILAGEHILDLPAQVALLTLMLFSTMLAALIAFWKGKQDVEHDRGGSQSFRSIEK